MDANQVVGFSLNETAFFGVKNIALSLENEVILT